MGFKRYKVNDVDYIFIPDSSGGVSSISAGAGLVATPNPIVGAGAISMPNVGPGAGTLGSSPYFVDSATLDAQGRVTNLTVALPLNWYRVTDKVYAGGAKGDGVTDDTAAIAAALLACSTAGGGVVYFPGAFGSFLGRYRMTSQVSLTLNPGPGFPAGANQGIAFVGDGGTGSTIVVDAHSIVSGGLFNFYSSMNMLWDRLLWEPFNTANDGTTDVNTSVLAFDSCFELVVRNCWFNGIRAGVSIIAANDNDFTLANCQITGCSVASGAIPGSSIISSYSYSNLRIRDCRFEGGKLCQGRVIDKTPGLRTDNVIYCNTPGNAAVHDMVGAVNQDTSEIRGNKFIGTWYLNAVFFDQPTLGQADLLYNRILIEDNNFDVLNASYRAIKLYDARYTRIARNWIGTSTTQGVGVELHNAGEVILEQNNPAIGFGGAAGATDISVDASTTSIIATDNTFRQYQITNPVATPTTVTTAGLTARIRNSSAAITQFALVKPDPSNPGQVLQLGTGDATSLATGVALDAAAGANVPIRVLELRGQIVTMLNDGAGALAPGDAVGRSGASPGRVVKVTVAGTNTVGRCYGSAAASADAPVLVCFDQGTV